MAEQYQITYTEGIILQARIELEAMLAENQQRQHRGESLAYTYDKISALIDIYGIHHNGLLTMLGRG